MPKKIVFNKRQYSSVDYSAKGNN